MSGKRIIRALCAGVALSLTASAVMGQSGTLNLELNKLEAAPDNSCRMFFLFRNDTETSFEAFEMSLAILDGQGVIDRVLSVDAAPLPAGRTMLKLFDISGMDCGAVSEVLLHDIPACQPQNGTAMDCFPLIKLESRAAARFFY
ncbi:hypothetical protein ACRARG_17705 [Pseudooceanicola sp. C21-150M6]|uniref:hypothetical protein n=1 Tax=Pseudooceanicola sp. C21-150M6 TaxID=3434355 RepID=UPI003D7FD5CC